MPTAEHRITRVFGWVQGVAALLVLALVVAVAVTGGQARQTASVDAGSVSTSPSAPEGTAWRYDPGDGIGDVYLADAGGAGYDVHSYDVTVTVNPATAQISGSTTITAVLTDAISRVHLDLVLQTAAVEVDGDAVPFSQVGSDLSVDVTRVPVGDVFEVVVTYSGVPVLSGSAFGSAVYRLGSELLIAGEPEGASAWYPCNEHPRDRALFRATVTVPRDVEAISVGRLVSRGVDPVDPTLDQWVWETAEETVTYATMLAVGQYEIEVIESVPIGIGEVQYVSAVAASLDVSYGLSWLRRSIDCANELDLVLGAYPSSALGGLVPPMQVSWGALETQGRPVYSYEAWGGTSIITHELAHFWFGNRVSLYQWQDIVLNEGMATLMEYLASVGAGSSIEDFFDQVYQHNSGDFWSQRLSAPGGGVRLFSLVIYYRGAMAIQAVRTRMGYDNFAVFLQAWANRSGPSTLAQWKALAQSYSDADLQPVFDAWFDQTTKPDASPELGFPS